MQSDLHQSAQQLTRQKILKMGIIPILFYLLAFCIFTFPLITQFSTHCYCDKGDGYQYLWKLWWMDKAVVQLHQSPWYTNYLYYPHGLSLLHDLNFSNGFIGLILLRFMTLAQVYNTIFLLGFVLGGLSAFWLAYELTGSYLASLLAGFIFTFSNDHFSHAALSHLTIISNYWIPLFILFWHYQLTLSRRRYALASALALFGAALTSFYFLYICMLAGFVILLWHMFTKHDALFPLRRQYRGVTFTFVGVVLLTSGMLSLSLLIQNINDPTVVDPFGEANLSGHDAAEYSTDILGMFTPGGRLGSSLLSYISDSRIDYRPGEHQAYPGALVWSMLLLGLISWRKWGKSAVVLWYILWLVAVWLALGPVLHIAGTGFPQIPMLYNLLAQVVPVLTVSGVPARMTVLAILAAAMISAYGFKSIFNSLRQQRVLTGIIFSVSLLILFIDFWPMGLPSHVLHTPQYVTVLKQLPDDSGVIDDVTDIAVALYYQTVHEKPIVFGYTSRATMSVRRVARSLRQLMVDENYGELCNNYHIRYLVVAPDKDVLAKVPDAEIVFQNNDLKIFDLRCTKKE